MNKEQIEASMRKMAEGPFVEGNPRADGPIADGQHRLHRWLAAAAGRRPAADLARLRVADGVVAELDELHERAQEHWGPPLDVAIVLRAETQDRRVHFVGGGGSSSLIGCDELDAIVHAAERGYRTCGKANGHNGRCWLPVDHRGGCGDLWRWRLLYGQPEDDPAIMVVCSTCTPHQHVPRPVDCPHGKRS